MVTNQPAPGAADASRALYEAFKAAEQAPDPNGLLPIDDFRHRFMAAFQVTALYVAQQDGSSSDDHRDILARLFNLDPIDFKALSDAIADSDTVNTSISFLCNVATLICDAEAALGQPADPSSNAMVVAANQIFRVVLAVPAGIDLSGTRADQILSRLVKAVPVSIVAEPVTTISTEPVAATGASERSLPPLSSLHLASPWQEPCPARLRDDETCVAMTYAALYEEKMVTRRMAYAGVSSNFRIMRGLSFRAGNFAVNRTRSPSTEYVANGTLCVTDQRLIFLSAVRNLDLPYRTLLSTSTRTSVIQVSKTNGGQFYFEQVSDFAVCTFEKVSGTSDEPRLMTEYTRRLANDSPNENEGMVRRFFILVVVAVAVVALYTTAKRYHWV